MNLENTILEASKKLKDNKMMYTDEVTSYASSIAKIKFIRNLLNKFQKKFSKNKKFIIEGRDIGSKILPNADLKLFFKCSSREKAKRRLKEFNKQNASKSKGAGKGKEILITNYQPALTLE